MFIDIMNFIFQGFWYFIGCVILISAFGSIVGDAITALLSPFQTHKHYHMNDTEIDMAEFESWKNEKDSQGQL